MKRALWAVPALMLIAASAWLARGSYSYWYSQTLYPASWYNWIVNENMFAGCYSSGGYCGAMGYFGATALHQNAYGGTRGEVKLTIRRDPNNPPPNMEYYSAYFGANEDPTSGAATFYEFTLNCSSGYGGVGFGRRTQNQSGYVYTQLAAASTTACGDPMSFRAVLNDTAEGRVAIAYLGGARIFKYTWTPSGDETYIGNNNGKVGFGLTACCGLASVAITNVDLGYADNVAPNAISSGSIDKSAYINHVDLSWPTATDDSNGAGVYGYKVWRNGSFLGSTTGLSFSDTTVNPSTTYSYTLKAVDCHGPSTPIRSLFPTICSRIRPARNTAWYQNSGGIWSSKESIYTYYNPANMKLYFRHGSF